MLVFCMLFVFVRVYVCVRVFVLVFMYVSMCLYVCALARVYICVCACMYVCFSVWCVLFLCVCKSFVRVVVCVRICVCCVWLWCRVLQRTGYGIINNQKDQKNELPCSFGQAKCKDNLQKLLITELFFSQGLRSIAINFNKEFRMFHSLHFMFVYVCVCVSVYVCV